MLKASVYLFFLVGFPSFAQKIVPYDGPFPEPAPNKNMLFYLQRSIDRNTVIYEVNFEPSGDLNTKDPVKVYWIDFESGAKKSSLTFVQSKFAYGIETMLLNEAKGIYQLALVSYKKIKLYLTPVGKRHYQVHTTIANKQAVLDRVFVNITGGTYFKPVISFIELDGKDLKTGALLSEQIKPVSD